MNLIEVETGKRINANIKKLTVNQIKNLSGSKSFQFDWSLEEANEVYSINRTDKKELLGLISLTDVSHELRIHINLVESNIKHQGRNKGITGIPGCLIGFACEMAFIRGYDGFVSLIPKTRLVNYYHERFGFLQMGTNMVVFLEVAQNIITKYLKDG
jgi:hypothetical protein